MNKSNIPSLSVYIASDHAGLTLKRQIKEALTDIHWIDLGPDTDQSVDYPEFARKLSHEVVISSGLGILICGSGIGMSIAANKQPGIRAAVVENPVSAGLAREHNHTNVLCLGARFLAAWYAAEIVRSWLGATPSEDPRHIKRVNQLK